MLERNLKKWYNIKHKDFCLSIRRNSFEIHISVVFFFVIGRDPISFYGEYGCFCCVDFFIPSFDIFFLFQKVSERRKKQYSIYSDPFFFTFVFLSHALCFRKRFLWFCFYSFSVVWGVGAPRADQKAENADLFQRKIFWPSHEL